MKKIILTAVITLVMTLSASAQVFKNDDANLDSERDGGFFSAPLLPIIFGEIEDQQAPLTGGAALLITFGAAYAMLRRRRDNK